ncbi:hypothetical protein D3877_23640 [Azospirillum cavernae]|uniref:5'-3' exonuclease domain-containing protein n=1 Tax=Azospirillum cavernae TaxID=2320860 RepID=A0A418VPE7_9PROT|nr:hypothetical protein [Azospirillum cavernae]RJF78124.1 hypothetical protein D3877_23640 [Azospirillum cavernae]
MIRIYDGNLVVRQRLETDTTGFCLRNLYLEAANPHGVLDIWVFDHPAGNAKRRDIYPDYKANREPPAEDVQAFMRLWQEMVRLTPAFSCIVPGYEGDDVMAHLAIRYAVQHQQTVEVVTRDADIRQLEQIPRITVTAQSLKDVPPNLIRLYKATVGDPSDNIKGVPGFGVKTWEGCDKRALRDWFEAPFDAAPPTDLPPKCKNAMAANPAHFQALYRLVGFLPIETELVNQHLVAGRHDPDAVETMLAQYLM